MARKNGYAPKMLPEKKAIRARPRFCVRPVGSLPSQLEVQLFPPLGVWASDAAWAACQWYIFKGYRSLLGENLVQGEIRAQ